MSVATLRSDIAAALENPSVWQVFSYPPASPLANSIIISPDDPYISPTNNNFNVATEVNFKMTLIVPLFDNQGNLMNIEDFITAAFLKLSEATNLHFRIGTFSAPSVLPVDAGQMLSSEVSLTFTTNWS
jgi:hypothetical protein